MDIISYSKAKKAGKAVKVANKRIGHTDKFKHDDKDIKDLFNTVDERITNIGRELYPDQMNKKISNLTKNTMINLNKHNLKLDVFMNANKYQHKEMVYDSFKDQSNKDSASVNVSYLNEGYSVSNKNNLGELHIKNIELDSPIRFIALSDISTEVKTTTKFEYFSKENAINVVEENNQFKLKAIGEIGRGLVPVDLSSFNNVIYISQIRGSDEDGDGTINKPFANYHIALEKAKDGDCIYIENGTYNMTSIYASYYWSSGIADKNKKITVTGEGQETVLVFKGETVPNSVSRDAPLFSMENKGSRVYNLRADFYPKSGSTYSRSIALWCRATFENVSVFVKGTNVASYSYFNNGSAKEPIWKNCVFHHSKSSVDSNYSGKPYYENCVSNATPAGDKLNFRYIEFDENNYLDKTTQEEGIGIYPMNTRYMDSGEVVLKVVLDDPDYNGIDSASLVSKIPSGSSLTEEVFISKDDVNYREAGSLEKLKLDKEYKYIKIKAKLIAGKKEIDGVQENIETPVIYNLRVEHLLNYLIKPKYYVSTDKGESWEEFKTNELYEIKKEGSNLKLKIVLEKDQRVDAISYSWI